MDLFFEDVDEYQEEQAERQIKIRVACDGMEQRAANYDIEGRQAALRVSSSSNSANHVITVVCNGKQTIKWLSLVVGQRLLGRRPRGARRSYEPSAVGRGGFIVPGEIRRDNYAMDPLLKISDVFKHPTDHCSYRPGAIFNDKAEPHMKIEDFSPSVPATYFSPFAQRAFYPSMSDDLDRSHAVKQRKAYYQQRKPTVGRFERSLKASSTERDVLSSKFRIVMSDKAEFGDDACEFASLAVDHLVSKMHLSDMFCKSVSDDVELEDCKRILRENIDLFDSAFKHYAGFSTGDATLISCTEFFHFTQKLKVFTDKNAYQKSVNIFKCSNRNAEKGIKSSHENDLAKHEFLESCFRLAHISAQEKDKQYLLSEAFQHFIDDYLIPSVAHVSKEDAVIKGVMEDLKVQALITCNLDALLLVYNYYAVSDRQTDSPQKSSRPTMAFCEFETLVHDAGLVHHAGEPHTDTVGGAIHELTPQEVRQAFGMAQADADADHTDMSEAVFAEFIEGVARIALAKWETDALLASQKVQLALQAVVHVESMIPWIDIERLMPEYAERLRQAPESKALLGTLRTAKQHADPTISPDKQTMHHHDHLVIRKGSTQARFLAQDDLPELGAHAHHKECKLRRTRQRSAVPDLDRKTKVNGTISMDAWSPPAWGPRGPRSRRGLTKIETFEAFEIRENVAAKRGQQLLSQIPFLSSADPEVIKLLVSRLRTQQYDQHAFIIKKGEMTTDVYFVHSGRVGVFLDSQETSPMFELKQGSFFGEIALLEDSPRSSTIKAMTRCALCVLTKAAFQEVLTQYPKFEARFREMADHRKNRNFMKPNKVPPLKKKNE